MKLLPIALSLLVLIQTCQAEESDSKCGFPWQKVNDDICLFLTSITKTWDHAKYLCNFYGGDLLYIENDTEQEIIQSYLSKLLRYRFNRKPYVWLDASDKLKESYWLWSRNNQTLEYSNWIPSHHNSGPSAKSLDCGCYKPNNGFWKDCDCSLSQHFTCRKSVASKLDNVLIDETPGMAGFHLEATAPILMDTASDSAIIIDQISTTTTTTQESLPAENNNEIMMDLILPSSFDEELLPTTTQVPDDLRRLKDQINARVSMLRARPKVSVNMPFFRNSAKRQQQSIASQAVNLMRIKLLKTDFQYDQYHCPLGFGYYVIEGSGCSKWKHCENWNTQYASMSVNKCRTGVFDFNRRMCVEDSEFECGDMVVKFVAEV